jgi:hypothetical protein
MYKGWDDRIVFVRCEQLGDPMAHALDRQRFVSSTQGVLRLPKRIRAQFSLTALSELDPVVWTVFPLR